MIIKVLQELRAPNDHNGNPRVLFVVREIDTAEFKRHMVAEVPYGSRVTHVIDKGYGNLPEALRYCCVLDGHFRISVSDFNSWIKMATQSKDIELIYAS